MTDAIQTRVSLLVRLRDAKDADAWSQFVDIYGPLVFNFARRCGIQEADAADLVQEVMSEVSKSIARFEYDPQQGKFRSWLYKIAKRTAGHVRRRQQRQPKGTGDTATHNRLNELPDTRFEDEQFWDDQYQRQLLEWAADRIRDNFQPATWQAFWLTAVEGLSAQEVAQQLGINVGSVYVAKNRVTKRLAEKVREIDDSE